jgi:glucose-1-phosphate cytidylyltransferase
VKVVLFCGGLGMRIRDFSERIPKPMVPIGYRPILWHVMKYYAHYGHTEFILCLGFGADVIKDYFLSYNECLSNDFVLSSGGRELQLLHSDIHDWRITFVDTGATSNIGQRLKAVERHLIDDEVFLANYADGLTDLPLDAQLADFDRSGKIASFASVRPNLSCHFVSAGSDGIVTSITDVHRANLRINGGYFAFRRSIFDHINDGEELLQEPFQRLLESRQLVAYQYDGFWTCMDTFKDKQVLEEMYARGSAPWAVWKTASSGAVRSESPGSMHPVARRISPQTAPRH